MSTSNPIVQHVRRCLSPPLNLQPPGSPPDLYARTLSFFTSIPWCASLLGPGPSRLAAVPLIPGCRNPILASDKFIHKTLGTDETLRHMLSFFYPEDAKHATDPDRLIKRVLTLFALGDDVSGYPGVLHGGMVMTMADEAMGALPEVNMNLGKQGAAFTRSSMTGRLSIDFLKPVPCPGVVYCEAWVEEVKGRKTEVRGEFRDEKGVLLARCSSIWVAFQAKI